MINPNGMIKKINMKPKSIERSIMTANLYNYLRFLYDSNQISTSQLANYISEVNGKNTYAKHYIQKELPQVESLLAVTEKLNSLYISVLKHASNYQLFTLKMPEANFTKLIKYAEDFFKYLDKDVYNLFVNIINNDLLYEKENLDYGGICFNIGNKKSALILRYDTYNLYKTFALVHEMGHSYHNYLNGVKPSLNQNQLGKECLSRTFEQLFFLYLRDNYLLDKKTLDAYERIFHIHQLDITNSSYIVNKLLLENKINGNFYLNKIKANIDKEEYQNLSIIRPKNEQFQRFLSYDSNYYAYAFIFSMIMREKFIKEFPYYNQNLNADELINLFDKKDYLNETNKNTSRILSKTKYKT